VPWLNMVDFEHAVVESLRRKTVFATIAGSLGNEIPEPMWHRERWRRPRTIAAPPQASRCPRM
jgi:hypothetical protein